MTLREKQAEFWTWVSLLILTAAKYGTPVVVLRWKGTVEEQKAYVASGASKTMKSKHLDGLAVDICFLEDLLDDGKLNYDAEKYRMLGEYWESLGGVWGGRFGDDPKTEKIEGWDAGHFQYDK